MKKEIPQGAVFGIIGVLVVGIAVAGFMYFRGGPGSMSSEDLKRAQMEAEVGNQRMQSYIGGTPGTPGAPGSSGGAPGGPGGGEAAARAKHAGGGQK